MALSTDQEGQGFTTIAKSFLYFYQTYQDTRALDYKTSIGLLLVYSLPGFTVLTGQYQRQVNKALGIFFGQRSDKIVYYATLAISSASSSLVMSIVRLELLVSRSRMVTKSSGLP